MLTNDQIQYLYKFCEKKSVRYYDLQVELVDHLAEAIEQKIQDDSSLSFENALAEVYKGFGIFGFAHVVWDKEAAMLKQYNRKKWKAFKSWFSYPKICITVLLFLVLNAPPYFLAKVIPLDVYYTIVCLGAALTGIGLMIYSAKKYKRPEKKLLMLQPSCSFGVFGALLQFPNLYYHGIKAIGLSASYNLGLNMLISAFCLFLILITLALYKTYRNTYREAIERYPAAFIGG